jgi:hypothetical protein
MCFRLWFFIASIVASAGGAPPVADMSYLYGIAGGSVLWHVYFSSDDGLAQPDCFVTFMDRALLFASFRADLPLGLGDYLGLRLRGLK